MSKDLDDEKFQALIGQVEESYRFADLPRFRREIDKSFHKAEGYRIYYGPPEQYAVLSPSQERDLMESHDLDDFLDDAKLRREALEIAIRLHTAPGLPAPADHQMVIRVARDILAFLQEKEG